MTRMMPKALTNGKLCTECGGTGADKKRTMKMKSYDSGYIRCWNCVGNGLDPAEYFSWGKSGN